MRKRQVAAGNGETLFGSAGLAGSAEQEHSKSTLTVWKIAIIVILSLLLFFSLLRIAKYSWQKRRQRLLDLSKSSSPNAGRNPSDIGNASASFSRSDDLERGRMNTTSRGGNVGVAINDGNEDEVDGSPAYSKEKGEGEKVLAVGAHVKAAVEPPDEQEPSVEIRETLP